MSDKPNITRDGFIVEKVTEVKEQTMTTVEELLELISVERDKAGKLVVKDVFGSVHGDVRGHVNGNVDGDVMGNIEGSVRGSIYGDVWGDVWWRVCGKVLNT